MKKLILNGSPHKNGDTSYIVNELKKKLDGEIEEIFLYDAKISPCVDCRYCWKNKGCAIKDDMEKIYKDDYRKNCSTILDYWNRRIRRYIF